MYYSYEKWVDSNSIDRQSTERLINQIFEGEVVAQDIIIWLKAYHCGLNEGTIKQIIGGASGLILGKKIGKLLANALGVKDGVLYDILTSRVVAARIGMALGKKK